MSVSNRQYAVGVARAFGGALLFSLPILMTMETWQLGLYMDRLRLALLLFATFPLLAALAYYLGFEESTSLQDAILDAFAAKEYEPQMRQSVRDRTSWLWRRLSIDQKISDRLIAAIEDVAYCRRRSTQVSTSR